MNRFSQLNIEQEEPTQQVKAAPAKKDQAPKKVVVKKVVKVENTEDAAEGFERITDGKTNYRQGGRGARGTVEGRRGGRGRGEGNRGRGRGGEGRGEGRGQRRPRTTQVDENGNATNVDRAERGGDKQRYQGKAREDGHPQDRRQGHELRRGDRKGGHGRGNWGDRRKPAKEEGENETPKTEETEAKKEENAEEKKEETPAAEEEVKEPVKVEEEEEEETGITLDDFLANRKSAGIKNQVRDTEKINQKNI
mmetsp:Transcript_27617/g.20024  ORF Transcript_27617/g.20024 Transcript_27617/m.20024 type:complete len:251 (-) Transcript_27617:459-1211(-)